ncbi:PREDICTED: C-C motif chemokine 3-like [Acanthisitta chloris]|uniref:C-C motif chemokine 3-like n=1 Tax=Acanthisitta chloris TaxID=57068 RepID=UPI0004F0F39D|nr:PREDICTED: C-C motif chemokine 3-like [Acanthisitta chloris]
MKTFTAALAVLFVAVLCYQVSSSPFSVNIPGHCCVQFITTPLPKSRVAVYEHTSHLCSQPAVIFTTVKGRLVCGRRDDKWVQDILSDLEDKTISG